MTRILLTGFPGFLAGRLLPELVREELADEVVCLVEPRMAEAARARLAALAADRPWMDGRVDLLEGDLTDPAIFPRDRSPGKLDRILHLAAAYRLDLDRRLGMAVNVAGTRHLLRLALRRPEPPPFLHVSTCYVSGRHPGLFREEDLEVGQRFNNAYEETKFLAELEVWEAAAKGLPVTVARPAIVAGDSGTGTTEKHDGLYYLLQWIHWQGPLALVPRVPGMREAVLNVVPSDFVVAALARMASRDDLAGRTFHLAHPAPLAVGLLLRRAGEVLGRRVVAVPVPLTLAHLGMWTAGRLPGVPVIPGASLAYLSHPTRYGTEATRPFLEEEGLRVLPMETLLPVLARRFLTGTDGAPGTAPAGLSRGA